MAIKDHLNRMISAAIEHVGESNRIILDTGDGAALCFTGDPEDALFAALNLRDALRTMDEQGKAPCALRMGINLGPAKLVKDLNGRINVIGDGINAAQRVMSFAAPNQILVSRSFYEVLSCLSEEYAALFRYEGERKDKHVRQYTVYEVTVSPESHGTQPSVVSVGEPRPGVQDRDRPPLQPSASTSGSTASAAAPPDWDPSLLQKAERDLAAHIGPLAKLLVKRTAQRTNSIEELYKLLSGDIADERARQAFLSSAGREEARPESGKGSVESGEAPEAAERWDREVLKALEGVLALYLGPVAKILVKRAAKQSSEREDLYQRLAGELPSEAQRTAFLQAVRKGSG